MANFGILAKLGTDTSKFVAGLKKAGDKGASFGKQLGNVVAAGAKVAAAAIAAMALKGIKDFVEFEKKMSEVFTLMPKMTKEAEKAMSDDMRRLATTMGIDVIDATNALYQAISAGVPKENAADFLMVASKAAIAGVSDLETSVGALTTIINGYSMEIGEAERVSDVLFSTVKIGVTNFTELGQNIGKVTPLAAELGISIEQVGGMFAVLTKTLGAGKTAEAGTGIRSMLAELSKEGMKAFENFVQATGTTFPNFIRSGRSVAEALQAMSDHAKDSDKSLIDMFRGVEAGMAALTLAKNNTEDLGKAIKDIKEDAGSAEKAYQIMAKTTAKAWDDMKAAAKEFGMSMGEVLLPLVSGAIDAIAEAFTFLGDIVKGMVAWFKDHPRALDNIMKSIKVVTISLLAMNGAAVLSSIVVGALTAAKFLWAISGGAVIRMLKALKIAMMTNPFTVILGIIVAVVAAFVLWGDAAEEAAKQAMDAADQFADRMEKRTKTAKDAIKSQIKEQSKLRKQLHEMAMEERMRESGMGRKKVALEMAKKELETMKSNLEIAEMMPDKIREDMAAREQRTKIILAALSDEATKLITLATFNEAQISDKLRIEELETERLKLTIAIKKQVELITNLTTKAKEEEEKRLKSLAEAKKIIADTAREHELSQTTMGKIILLSDKLNKLNKERKKILDDIAAGTPAAEDSLEELAKKEKERLNTQKQIADLMEGDLNRLREREIVKHEEAIGKLEINLGIQEEIIDAEKRKLELLDAQLKVQNEKVAVARMEAEEIEAQFAGNKFNFVTGERRGIGEFKLSSAKLGREFKLLKEEGRNFRKATQEDVDKGKARRVGDKIEIRNAREFQKHIEGQLRAKKEILANEKAAQAKLLRDQAAAIAMKKVAEDKAKAIEDGINAERDRILKLRGAMNKEEVKTLAQITTERIRLEAALAAFRNMAVGARLPRDPGLDRAMDAMRVKIDNAVAAVAAVVPKPFGAGAFADDGSLGNMMADEALINLPDVEGDTSTLDELKGQTTIAEDTLLAIEGKFVNQPT